VTCVTPAHAAGAVSVVLTTTGGSATKASGFTYVAAPTITSISPNSGGTAGGTAVTITGTNLTTTTGVTFGGVAATAVTVVSATSVTCNTPAGAAGAVDVVLSTGSGSVTSTNGFTYGTAPTIITIVPSSGPIAGGSVTINGANLSTTSGVTFGGVAATGMTATATSISCTAPAHAAGAVDVVVNTLASGSATAIGGYTYLPGPTLTVPAFSPASGAAGAIITITGTGFTGVTAVTFNGVSAVFVFNNDTTITATVPTGATTGAVAVTTPGGTATSSSSFTVTGGSSTAASDAPKKRCGFSSFSAMMFLLALAGLRRKRRWE
jgi:hypothetical protein